MPPTIADNLRKVNERIAAAAARAGRAPQDVALVAVAKTRTAAEVAAAVAAGVTIIGENRVQEAAAKIAELAGLSCSWHLVGHLQRNKAARAVELFDVIHSLDSRRLADALGRRAAEVGKTVEVLLEVNTSGEETKFGVRPDDAEDFAGYAAAAANIRVCGLMTVGPLGGDAATGRQAFRTLRRLFERLAPSLGNAFRFLSMGMTDDFEAAIAEGSNMVRIGRAIFGPR